MSTATALASVGDHGVLNAALPQALSQVWIDRDLGWLDFNECVLAKLIPMLYEQANCYSHAVIPGLLTSGAASRWRPTISA